MSGLGDWVRCVRTLKVRNKLSKTKGCQIDGRSDVNFTNCTFEGNNKVGKFTILNHSSFGFASYISENSCLLHTSVGKFSAIGPYVHVVNGQHPTKKFVSIHPAFYSADKVHGKTYMDKTRFEESKYANKQKGLWVCIGNDVWIGDSVSIMEGVTVADGTIIAAGSVVVKDTEPYSVIGGNPAKLIRYRFEKAEIDYLLGLQWWNYDEEWFKRYAPYFDDVNRLKKVLEDEEMK